MKKTKSKKSSNSISANISFKEATFSQTANRLDSAINGSHSSQHINGQAIDISSLGDKSNGELFEWIRENCQFDQLIWEFGNDKNPNWIHISYVNPKTNRNRVLKAKKRGSQTTYFVI
jgi:hypothetical protein